MSLDGSFLSLVKKEIEPLIGGRVEKICQPARDQIIMHFHTYDGKLTLLLSSAANAARVHLTKDPAENPKSPPMFCMLLRKRLSGGRLMSIRQDGLERILFFDFQAINELGDAVSLTLISEIMGKRSNLILIDDGGKIIDCIIRVSADMSRERLVLPGMRYETPPRDDRLDFRRASPDVIKSALSRAPDGELSKILIKIFEGISPVIAREWAHYAARGEDIDKSCLSEERLDRLLFIIKKTAEDMDSSAAYTAVKDKDGTLKDFSHIKINQYGNLCITKSLASACETLDYFYSERDRAARLKQRSNDLFKLLMNLTDKISNRIAAQTEDLETAGKRGELKIKGDLISANLYSIEKGVDEITLENFYEEGNPLITVKLDPLLSPSQNMQKYYSEYRKSDTAAKILSEQIKKGAEDLEYIDSVFDALTRAQTEDEQNVIRFELMREGFIKSIKLTKGREPKSAPPLEFISPEGYKILVGRNNRQNDILTTKTAEKTDIWLHTKNIAGAHVIIQTKGQNPPDGVITFAARLAAQNSKAKNSSRVPVDYVQARYVKKPSGAKPGMVIFTNNKTVYVNP